MARITNMLLKILRSKGFFWGIVAFFAFEALWFVFSAVYPMAFDEEFHLGVIRIYAQQWSPILASQPDGQAPYGALTVDPSYLYHYLMSFPYRLVALFTDNETAQVLFLRLINVAIFTYGLVLFRKVLLQAKTSQALTNVVLAIFVLVPIAPMLAAHINYDNALFLLTACLCLLMMRVVKGFEGRRMPVLPLCGLIITAMFTCLVKYAALPLVLGLGLYLLLQIWRHFKGHWRVVPGAVADGFRALSTQSKIALTIAGVVALCLFVQRYGVNLYRYHTPVPDCDAIISVERCQAYGPFARNHRMHIQNDSNFNRSPFSYSDSWFQGMWHRLYFAVNGPASGWATRLELPIPSKTIIVVGAMSAILLIWYWRRVFEEHTSLTMFMFLIITYCTILWINNYTEFLYTRQAVAINGRYLIPLLPLMGAVAGRAFSLWFGKHSRAKVWIATVALLLLLHGGGIMTFILRSDHTWDWPNNIVYSVNDTARNILRPIIIEGKPVRSN